MRIINFRYPLQWTCRRWSTMVAFNPNQSPSILNIWWLLWGRATTPECQCLFPWAWCRALPVPPPLEPNKVDCMPPNLTTTRSTLPPRPIPKSKCNQIDLSDTVLLESYGKCFFSKVINRLIEMFMRPRLTRSLVPRQFLERVNNPPIRHFMASNDKKTLCITFSTIPSTGQRKPKITSRRYSRGPVCVLLKSCCGWVDVLAVVWYTLYFIMFYLRWYTEPLHALSDPSW